MAIKSVLATTPTTATISVSGDLTFDNFVDIDIDVDTLGRDETASNPEVLINQVDYDINAGSGLGARVERVTVQPNPTSADKDDDYTYTTTLEFFTDTLDYDNLTGEDKTSGPTKPS